MSDNARVFGLVLGNSFSSISWIDESGRPQVIPNIDGECLTPSYVYFESQDKVCVGEVARQMLTVDPERVVRFNIREIANASYAVKPFDVAYSMMEVGSLIVRRLANGVRDLTGSCVENVALSCPAWCNSAERRALIDCVRCAGLEVVDVVDAPLAAAYAYAEYADGDRKELPEKVLIFDLGGSSLEVCIVRRYSSPTRIEIVATGGDSRLGGCDWDGALADLIASKSLLGGEVSRSKLNEPDNRYELMQVSERIKKLLLGRTAAKALLRLNDETTIVAEVSREEFEEATAPLLERAIQSARQVLVSAAKKEGVDAFQIDAILCTGGGCLMAQIPKRLECEFGKPVHFFEPHLCVAKGTAALGNRKKLEVLGKVLGKSYGILLARNLPDGSVGEVIFNLLLRNQRLSTAWYSQTFRTTSDGFRRKQIKLVESDSGCWQNGLTLEQQDREIPFSMAVNPIIHAIEIQQPPHVHEDEPIIVTFHADGNGCIDVSAVMAQTSEPLVVRGDDKVRPAAKEVFGLMID